MNRNDRYIIILKDRKIRKKQYKKFEKYQKQQELRNTIENYRKKGENFISDYFLMEKNSVNTT